MTRVFYLLIINYTSIGTGLHYVISKDVLNYLCVFQVDTSHHGEAVSRMLRQKATVSRPELSGGFTFHHIEYVQELSPAPSNRSSAAQQEEPPPFVDATIMDNIKQNLITRQPAMDVLMNLEIASAEFFKNLLNIEDSLLNLVTNPDCTEGVCYASVFSVNEVIVCRYLETGSYLGFLEQHARQIIAESRHSPPENILIIEMFTAGDIDNKTKLHEGKNATRKPSKADKRTQRGDKIYKRNLSLKKEGIVNRLGELDKHGPTLLPNAVKLKGLLIHTAQKMYQHNIPQHSSAGVEVI